MQQTAGTKLYSLGYSEARTYLFAALFIIGNMLLPQLLHTIPRGGMIWLPIYFFTLVGSYKYGWKVGLLTAFLSPVLNSLFFSMPSMTVLPAILIKSTLLAVSAGFAASYFKKVSIETVTIVVLSYQIAGTLGEWALTSDFMIAIQDFRIGIPGMLVQILGGFVVIKYLLKK